MHFTQIAAILSLTALTAGVFADHAGHEDLSPAGLARKRDMIINSQRSVDACSGKLAASGLTARAIARRQAIVDEHRTTTRQLRGKVDHMKRDVGYHVDRRDEISVLATNHNHTGSGITENTDEATLFASNGTCILNPTTEYGPFWVKGEYVRSDLADGQSGVPVIIDGQFIDASTCEPLTDLYWDIWSANSTGVYSGVVTDINGNGDDAGNINATFLRGIQPTDEEGVVKFSTLFPGHYSGRATHTHVLAHVNATVLENGTLSGGHVAFMGHMFWDQDLITEVENTYPYTLNTIELTTNADDVLFPEEAAVTDPVFNYVYLGDTLEDGLFAWITVAVNVSATYAESYSFELTSSGGIASDNSQEGGGGSGGPGSGPGGDNGTFPGGL